MPAPVLNDHSIEFLAPPRARSQGIGLLIQIGFAFGMIAMLACLAIAVLLFPLNPSWPLTACLIVLGTLFASGGFFLATRVLRNELGRRLVLSDDAIHLKRLIHWTRINYEEVRLVEVAAVKRGIESTPRVQIHLNTGRVEAIRLAAADASECLNALQTMCERAASLSHEGEVRMPGAIDAADQARAVLVTSLRRGARRDFFTAVLAFCAWILFGAVAVSSIAQPSSHSNPKIWWVVVILPVGVVALLSSAIKKRNAARQHALSALHH